jgi:hypothetical protein
VALRCRTPRHRGHLGTGKSLSFVRPLQYIRAYMTILEVRHKNFLLLVEQHGGQAALAKATGKAPAYISQLTTRIRNLGEASSRGIERALGLPQGWFDTPHTPAESSTPFPVEAWDSLPPHARTLILSILEFFRVNGATGTEQEEALLRTFRSCSTQAREVVLAVASAQSTQALRAPSRRAPKRARKS